MLPLVDGKEILKEIRSQYDTPIIVVTAREEEVDRILGLDLALTTTSQTFQLARVSGQSQGSA